MIITVPAICKTGSFSGFDWDKSFFDTIKTAIEPEDEICRGIGSDSEARVYTIPLTREENVGSSCNMEWEVVDKSDIYTVFLNILLQDRISNIFRRVNTTSLNSTKIILSKIF
jgi:hypothetical protein